MDPADLRNRRRSSSESGENVLDAAKRDAEKEHEEDITITAEVLAEKARRDAAWANLAHSFAPTFLLGPIVPAMVGMVLITVNSIALRFIELQCVQPLDTFLRGITGLSWILILAVANQLLGPWPIISITGNLILFNLILFATFLWAIIGLAWYSLAEPCSRSAPALYGLAMVELLVLVLGGLLCLVSEMEWCVRYGCFRREAPVVDVGDDDSEEGDDLGDAEEGAGGGEGRGATLGGGEDGMGTPAGGKEEATPRPRSALKRGLSERGAGAITAAVEDEEDDYIGGDDDEDEEEDEG